MVGAYNFPRMQKGRKASGAGLLLRHGLVRVGTAVGADVGTSVGTAVGASVGAAVGALVSRSGDRSVSEQP